MPAVMTRFELEVILAELWADSTTHERRDIVNAMVGFLNEHSKFSVVAAGTIANYEIRIHELKKEHAEEVENLEEQLQKALKK
jgi:hypothetical protein